MKKLYFENSRAIEREIAEVKDIEEAVAKINEFCDERNYKIYYMRSWIEGKSVVFDVGSHTEFFKLRDIFD